MKQLVYILKHCGPDDLILADELGSGTDPAEGSAIAIAILDSLYQKESYVMVTTHYNDLKNYAYNTPGIENGHVEFDMETLKPTYKLRIGSAGSSHAFSISERWACRRLSSKRPRNCAARPRTWIWKRS